MNRLALAALWIVTIAGTWLIVRETTSRPDEPAAIAPHRTASPMRSTARMPALRQRTEISVGDDAAFQTAMATLQRDIADGSWSVADRDRLNNALRRSTGEQVKQLLAVLFPKLNARTIKSEIDGPPI